MPFVGGVYFAERQGTGRGIGNAGGGSGRYDVDLPRTRHVVIKMREPGKAKQFYHGIPGMKIASETPRGLFSIGVYAAVPEYDGREEGRGGIARPFDLEAVAANA